MDRALVIYAILALGIVIGATIVLVLISAAEGREKLEALNEQRAEKTLEE